MQKETETCFGCDNFYITYMKGRPYGCKAFGFISKKLPSIEVFSSSGIHCAYRKSSNINSNKR